MELNNTPSLETKVIKSGGYCCDGCQWVSCGFLKRNIISREHSIVWCTMFGNSILHQGGKSLNICNTIYGLNYDDYP